MEILFELSNFFLNINLYLESIIQAVGPLTYLLLFLIIFAETGLVIALFLPGDSLIFLSGTLSGAGLLNFWTLYITFVLAAILGDNLNYWIGNKIGPRVFSKENSKVFNKKNLAKTHDFFEKHGSKAILIARFVPLMRTFAPFVAGIGSMNYKTFLIYNVIGAFLWVSLILSIGYFLGSQPFIRENFQVGFLILIAIALTPMLFGFLRKKYIKNKNKKESAESINYSEIKEVFEEKNN